MGDIWFTSDLHLMHSRDFLWRPRGFESVEEMNEAIVERWNSIVKPEDTVFNLGDIALSDTDAAIPYIQRLNGKQIWIRGNHDSDNRVMAICAACPNVRLVGDLDTSWAYVLKDGKWRFYLSHYATKVANYDDAGSHKTWCLCGHRHSQDKWADLKDSCYHVELDAHDCYPVNLDQIKADIRAKREEQK